MDTSTDEDHAALFAAFGALVADATRRPVRTVAASPDEVAAHATALDRPLRAGGWDEVATGDAFVLTRLVEVAAAAGLQTPSYPLVETWLGRRALAQVDGDPPDLGDRWPIAGFGAWLVDEPPSFPSVGPPAAALYFAAAGSGDAVDLMWTDLPGPGLSPVGTPDRTQPRHRLDADVVSSHRIGTLPRATAELLAGEFVLLEAAELLGLATVLFDTTARYTGERIQFGRPISSFQAPRHRLVDHYVAIETLRSLTYYASWARSADTANFVEHALGAKGYAAEHACATADTSIQLHGAMGYSFETGLQFPVGRAYARALAAPSGAQCFAATGELLQRRGSLLALAE